MGATFVPFTAQTRMSGVDLDGRRIRKGAADALQAYVTEQGGRLPREVADRVDAVAREGGTPLVVADGARVLGVIHLKDIVKGGIKERFRDLRRMGIKTVMITGDNPVTAASIAAEAGVDDFLAEATPEAKLALIRQYQAEGHLVAMTGDGTNDAPALAQADVAVAMNTGTQAAKEAGNMVDLDSNPTKLLEIVHIGKQTLMTRRLTHHLQHRQRYRQVLRHHPGGLRRHLSPAEHPQRHAPHHPTERRALCRHLQRRRHRVPHPPRTPRGQVQATACSPVASQQPADLRVGWAARAVRRDQDHRPTAARTGPRLRGCTMLKMLRQSLVALVVLGIVVGVIYPLAVTGISQAFFPHEAEGSMIVEDGIIVGSELIGQPFSDPAYFWSRPSATAPIPYNAAASAGSNLGPTNPAMLTAVEERIQALRAADPGNEQPVPVDLVTSSGSGLDPHISPAAAEYQVNRVAAARGLTAEQVRAAVAENTEGRQWGVLGEPRVNVLELNLALDTLTGR